MPSTEREKVRCAVKEESGGQPFLFFELLSGPEMPSSRGTGFGFDLRTGTTLQEAHELATQINDKIESFFALKS